VSRLELLLLLLRLLTGSAAWETEWGT